MIRNIGTPSLAYQSPAGGMPSQSQLLSGFAETLSQYLCEVQPGGGNESPEPALETEAAVRSLWNHNAYERVEGIDPAEAFYTNERDIPPFSHLGHGRQMDNHTFRRPEKHMP